jgi:hypothetical protein
MGSSQSIKKKDRDEEQCAEQMQTLRNERDVNEKQCSEQMQTLRNERDVNEKQCAEQMQTLRNERDVNEDQCAEQMQTLRNEKADFAQRLEQKMTNDKHQVAVFKNLLSKVILLNVVYTVTATEDTPENVVIKTDKYTKTYNLKEHKDQFQISNVIGHGGHSVEIKTTNKDGTKASFFQDELWFIKKVGKQIQIKLSALDKFEHPDTTCFWDNCYFIHIVEVGEKEERKEERKEYDDNESITLNVKREGDDDNQVLVLTHELKGHSRKTYLKQDGTPVEWMNTDLETYLKNTQANRYIVYMYNDKEKNALETEERIRKIDKNTYDAVTIKKN